MQHEKNGRIAGGGPVEMVKKREKKVPKTKKKINEQWVSGKGYNRATSHFVLIFCYLYIREKEKSGGWLCG